MLSRLLREHDRRCGTAPAPEAEQGRRPAARAAHAPGPPEAGGPSAPRAPEAPAPPPPCSSGWTIMPDLPVALDLPSPRPPRRAAGGDARLASGEMGKLEGPQEPQEPQDVERPAAVGRAARAVVRDGTTWVRLPDGRYLADLFATLRFAPLGGGEGRSSRLPERYYGAMRRELFPSLHVYAGQEMSAEQLVDVIVYAIYAFDGVRPEAATRQMDALMALLLAGMLPPGQPDLTAAAEARLGAIKRRSP